jgi:hypothetical protein
MSEPLISNETRDEVIGESEQESTKFKNSHKKDKTTRIKEHYEIHNNLLEGTNIFSKLFFYWIGAFAAYGNHFEISKDNAPILPDNQKPKI